jgi:transposase
VTVMIGVDPHKATHTAVAIDGREVELARVKVRASKRQSTQLLAWAAGFEDRAWAVESAGGLGYLLAQQLLAAGETVWDVPATLAARVRVLGTGRSDKNDPNDARSVAVAALRAPALVGVRAEDHVTVLRLLAKRHLGLGRWRNKVCRRLHALVAELVPGGIAKEVVVAQASQLLDAAQPVGAAAQERHRLALELIEDLVHIDTQIRESRRRITAAVAASGTTVTDVFGVGPVIAATLIGYTGDPRRFDTEHRYAAYTAPRPSSSPPSAERHIVSPGAGTGDSTTRSTWRRSPRSDTRTVPAAGYFERKITEGKTPKEALRALKRRVSDAIYRRLITDAERASH